jgi:hypothetical protein
VGVNGSAVSSSLDFKVSAVESGLSVARPLLTAGAYIDGTNGLVLSGLSGNYALTPDSAALDITGDIDVKIKLTMPDWTPAANMRIVCKLQTNTQRSWEVALYTSGVIGFSHSTDGTTGTQTTVQSSVGTGLANGATKWIRATMDVDDGAGNRVHKFYLSDDGSSWSQLGSTAINAGTTSIFNSTSQLEIGGTLAGTASMVIGTVHRVIIEDGFDGAGSVVFDADFAAEAADTLAFTEDSTNAATVSVITTRYTVGLPGMPPISYSTQSISKDIDYFVPFNVTQPIEVDMLAFEITTAPSSTASVYAAIYAATDDMQPTGAPLMQFGPISVATGVTGVYYAQVTPVTFAAGRHILGFSTSEGFTARYVRYPIDPTHTLGTNAFWFRLGRLRTAGAFPNPAVGWSDRVSASNSGVFAIGLLRWKAL